jgi:hypothetical protein
LNIKKAISVRGSVEGMAGAEAIISSKLRTSRGRNDLSNSTTVISGNVEEQSIIEV